MAGRSRWVVLAVAVSLLVAHALFLAIAQGPACIDDAYISFRYARNLADGQGLVFNPGEWVEGYTNFGWVLLLSVVHRLGLDLPMAARAANLILCGLLMLTALTVMARRVGRQIWAVALAGGLLAADGSLARWSQDGLETILFALLVLVGAGATAREIDEPGRRSRSSIWFAASAWVRPEGILLFAASFARRVWTDHRAGRGLGRASAALLGFTLLVVPLFIWRFATYGTLLPNTFFAKVGGTDDQFLRGLRYIGVFLAERWPALALAAVAVATPAARKLAPWHLHFLWLAAVHAVYVVAVGGDWMGPGRFLVPVLALAYLPLASAAAISIAPRAALAGAVVCLWLSSSFFGERPDVMGERPFSESRFAVARFLVATAKPSDRVLTNEIGQIGWVTGLPTSDMHGLTDPHIARLTVAGMGSGRAGHEKTDMSYSFAQDPAWVVIPNIATTFAARRDTFPPFSRYEPVRVPEKTPRPEYQVILRRRGAAKAAAPRYRP